MGTSVIVSTIKIRENKNKKVIEDLKEGIKNRRKVRWGKNRLTCKITI